MNRPPSFWLRRVFAMPRGSLPSCFLADRAAVLFCRPLWLSISSGFCFACVCPLAVPYGGALSFSVRVSLGYTDIPQISAHFLRVCSGPAIAHGWLVSSCSILVLLGPSTAGLAVSGVPGLFISATGTVFGTRAPARALSLTPWIAIVGALPKSIYH